ncbi:hypothetical protein LMH87_003690 [Akanthomyces muscarius]|uniref:Uncharacterized protein n=1 Tax=Akanthomyces muscarius TaxID=2231603 RepID=A0A9W8Q338_AKAMU|nr:hypothetical protein LMH87_003690 [Akanthomyces muscarius]KAJ4144820.1 hypothetical protein LMH87_003690 [Akanthomyces muscarius]
MSSSSFDEERPFVSKYKQNPGPSQRRTKREKAAILLLVLNALGTLSSILSLAFFLIHLSRMQQVELADCFDDTLLNPPIIWETRTFNSTVDEKSGVVEDLFTPSSHTTAADWESILDVGEIRLTNAEAARLSQNTSHLYGGEDGYAGVLEVFQQLDCLNRIRKQFFNVSSPVEDAGDSEHLRHWRDKHCFDYLWQTLLCHADVSVMTVGWNEKQQAFSANFAVTKQCRNFEAIHNWAKNREASFKPPGGTHPGIIESRELA